jgi:hypothetical protein
LKPFDIQGNFSPQITFDHEIFVNYFADSFDLCVGQFSDAGIGIDLGGRQDFVRSSSADAIDIGQAYLNALFPRQVYT